VIKIGILKESPKFTQLLKIYCEKMMVKLQSVVTMHDIPEDSPNPSWVKTTWLKRNNLKSKKYLRERECSSARTA
jgi:hypothetical protein